MRIKLVRLLNMLEAMAVIGATPGGGVTRLALTDADRAGRDQVTSWMTAAGLEVVVDDLGNMTGRRPGTEPGARPVIIGSHCDSVRQGGRFDGTLGVLAGIEVVRTLNDLGVATRHPIAVVNWTNEEGARFEPAMLASGAVAGRFSQDYVYSRTDRNGLSFEQELRRIGYRGREQDRPERAQAYLELHIEQGPVLEELGAPVGVVEGIVGIVWCEVTVVGQADHAGPSPMHLRRDALATAAELITAVPHIVGRVDSRACGTVGRIRVEPDIINVIPGRAVFSVDLRHPEPDRLEELVAGLQEAARAAAARAGVQITVSPFWTSPPTPFAPEVVSVVHGAVEQLGLAVRRLWSGAGHDAKYMQEICPTAMIFVRSRGGLSHCEAEYSDPDDLEAGANALLIAAVNLANEEATRS